MYYVIQCNENSWQELRTSHKKPFLYVDVPENSSMTCLIGVSVENSLVVVRHCLVWILLKVLGPSMYSGSLVLHLAMRNTNIIMTLYSLSLSLSQVKE